MPKDVVVLYYYRNINDARLQQNPVALTIEKYPAIMSQPQVVTKMEFKSHIQNLDPRRDLSDFVREITLLRLSLLLIHRPKEKSVPRNNANPCENFVAKMLVAKMLVAKMLVAKMLVAKMLVAENK